MCENVNETVKKPFLRVLLFEVYLFSQKLRFFGRMSGKREINLHISEKSCTFAGKIDMKGNKTMVATNLSQTATQMIVNIDDRSIVNDIRRLLTRIKGVSSVRVRNNYYESREFYQDLDAAEQDIANGKGVRVSSKQELDALFA